MGLRRPASFVDLREVQGNVVRGYGHGFASYVFARVTDAPAGRRSIAALADPVTTAEEWDEKPARTLNVALSHDGLEALGVEPRVLATFPDEFRAGMAARSAQLGDAGRGQPEHWEAPLRPGEVHVLLTVYGIDADERDRAAAGVREILDGPRSGLAHHARLDAQTLEGAREHFGFADGFAQPAILGDGRDVQPGQGIPGPSHPWCPPEDPDHRRSADGQTVWRSVRAGEFVLGYLDEDGRMPPAPAAPFDRNATFMVWRKLHQDVAGFRAMRRRWGEALGLAHDLVAAKIVGRWPDGTPLEVSPDAPDPELMRSPARRNDFGYSGDPVGLRCPRGAHVRRANPRDALKGVGGTLTARHRILRRGMPYGKPLPEHEAEDDGADRGLAFVCLQASIARQFEIVQSQWCNDGNAFGLGHDVDAIAGTPGRPARVTIEGRPPRYLAPLDAFTWARGG